MDELLLNKLKDNLRNTNNENLNQVVIQNYLTDINHSIKELNDLLEDVQNNDILNLQKKEREMFIEKKTMEPFIKHLIVYNAFLNNLYH
jgi:hypothetical protein